MKIGYARVSTVEQNLSLQHLALKEAGCDVIFEDHVFGMAENRPGLDKAAKKLKSGDVLVVWRLDRLGRSLAHLIRLVTELGDRGVEFQSLTENIDTTTAGGRLLFHIMGALAEFERSLISERTSAGMRAAKARGSRLGRPPALTAEQVEDARKRVDAAEASLVQLAEEYGVHPDTVSNALKRKRS